MAKCIVMISKSLKIFAATALLLVGADASALKRSTAVSELGAYTAPQSTPASVSVVFMPDGVNTVEQTSDCKRLVLRDIASGKEGETLFDVTHTRETTIPDFEGFTVSPDGSKVMVWRNTKMIYRRSFDAEYYVYEVRSRILRPLSVEHPRQRIPLFSPDSRMVAFVADNNIYAAKLDYNTCVAVTTDGKANEIINGATDWTYEEEFTLTQGMTWAPDNLTLCYLRFDESRVPMYSLPLYEGTCNRMEQYSLYPGWMNYKYPVAGEPNSVVTVHSYDVETRKTKQVDLPGAMAYYIPRIEYGPDASKLLVATLNRDQNRYEIFVCNPKSTVSKSVYVEESKAWIESAAYENLYVGANSFVVSRSDADYTRYYEYSYTGSELRCTTPGDHDATAYYGSDAAGNHYFQAAAPTPKDRTIYRLDKKGAVTALTPDHGTANADFAPGCTHMVLNYSNVTTPPVYTLNRADGKQLRTLEDNKEYAERAGRMTADKEFFSFRTPEGIELNGYVVKPRNFSQSKKYPVVMSQYSGPGSQSVLDKWTLDWEAYFANNGFVVVCVDGRGTGGRGTAFRTAVYKQLGHYETIDQVAAARYAGSLPYADASQIGIYGWSYGGYEALMCASADDCPYAAAVAIAPVTDWRFYDTVYTERYMLTPQQNERGYADASAINRILHLDCPLLMMYGTADDNVHPANTLQYVSTLQSAGMLCDMFVFPNMNHSINGCNARAVVYGRIFEYFSDKLRK